MVCGTTSDAGKSTVVAGLCRLLARRGVAVAPFKGQNMANNSWVTVDGGEIGRSTAAQALAAGIEPEVAMNPVLLKPTSDVASQVVVLGRPVAELDAVGYHQRKARLLPVVLDALADLRSRFDVVVLEGAGSPAEINLLARDIVNLPLALAAGGVPAVLVGDIERGGVFAQLLGTVELLPPELRALVRAFVVNRMRGDPALLGDGFEQLERRCGIPTLGVLPHLGPLLVDAEDSLALERQGPDHDADGGLDVAVVRLPRISNFTDLDPLVAEPAVDVRWVSTVGQLGPADLVVLPGTKATVDDLAWLRRRGFDRALPRLVGDGVTVLGICGGYQAMGAEIVDRVESRAGTVAGLGLLPARTVFQPEKVTRRRVGRALGVPLDGYQIHHGVVSGDRPWIELEDGAGVVGEGSASDAAFGTTVHGLFEGDAFRRRFLADVAARRGRRWEPSGLRFADLRTAEVDRVADAIDAHLDVARLLDLASEAGR